MHKRRSELKKELREKTEQELIGMAQSLSSDLFHLDQERRTSDQFKQAHLVKSKRRMRARALTLLREKQIHHAMHELQELLEQNLSSALQEQDGAPGSEQKEHASKTAASSAVDKD